MTGDTARTTPLHPLHLALDAKLVDFAGWLMPVRYASDLAEHHAVRERAGLFDLSHMGEIEVTGSGAPDALDHAFVSRLGDLDVGRAKYTMMCGEGGGILDDVIVYRQALQRFLVVANAVNAGRVFYELRARAAPFDATVTDVSADTALIAVQGPVSRDVLGELGVDGLDGLRYFAGADVTVEGVRVWLARTGYTGEDGFELYCPAGHAVRLWEALAGAGEVYGLAPAGLAARDTLRLEAGMPLYGNELDEQRTPFDAGLGRIVHLDDARDDFVGRAALEQVAAVTPATQLVGLAAEGRRAPRHGHPVVAGDGRQVGEVTSGALSPTLGHPIAMVYVTQDPSAVEGLTVDVRGTAIPVRPVELPFYRRSR